MGLNVDYGYVHTKDRLEFVLGFWTLWQKYKQLALTDYYYEPVGDCKGILFVRTVQRI